MNQRCTIPSLQGTFAKRSKPALQPNFAKEPFSPSRSNPKIADAQETKNSASIEVLCLIMNKAQHTTLCHTPLSIVTPFAKRQKPRQLTAYTPNRCCDTKSHK